MTLDPKAKAALDGLAQSGSLPTAQMPPPMVRAAYHTIAKAMDDATVEVGKIEDLKFPGPKGECDVRVYTPGEDPRATLLWFHGGGFVMGGLETHDGLFRRFCAQGLRVVAPAYRLAPEHRHQAQIDDALAAAEWTFKQYADLPIAVGGDAAGGNLAAIVIQRDASGGRPRIKFQILFCPWLDLFADPHQGSRKEFASGYFIDLACLDAYRRHYLGNSADPKDVSISPIRTRSLDDLPPAYIMTAQCDPLCDDGRIYAERLRAADVEATYCESAGMIHHFYCMARAIPAADPAIAAAAQACLGAVA